jgi:hypothetical protein
MYFLFTSLSTVGFGDFYPRSDAERFVGTWMLLIGVSIFSYSMTIFINILDNYKSMNDDLDDGDNLSKFFGMMTRFNNGKKIDHHIKKKIEEFFEYKWKYCKNQAIDDDDERSILSQIPYEVQNKLYSDFLHKQFLVNFTYFFRFRKSQKKLKI